MAKTLKLKCLTDEHLEKHCLEPEDKGKIGVFDGEELIGVALRPMAGSRRMATGTVTAKTAKSWRNYSLLKSGCQGSRSSILLPW